MSILPIFHNRRRNSYDPNSRETWEPFNENNYGSGIKSAAVQNPHPHVISHHHHHHANESLANARIEWKETTDAYFIRMELPAGIRREEIRMVVEDDKLLTISGERAMEHEDSHDNSHHVECSRSKFTTAFMLPEDARPDQVRSTMENGVLNITVPKRRQAGNYKHHVRPVEIVV